jgi:multidrug efflux pump subunit AcrA (membrane-fusion protein)
MNDRQSEPCGLLSSLLMLGSVESNFPERRDADQLRKLPKIYLLGGGAILLLIIGLVVGAIHPYKHVMGSQPVTLPDVEVLQVQQQDVPIYGEFIGTLDGLVNADVRAQVTGYLLKQGYEEGRFVKQGQLLFQIDPRPFQAALDQAQGQLTQAKAMLANAQAVQRCTELDVERYTALVKEQAASQQDFDNAVQNTWVAILVILSSFFYAQRDTVIAECGRTSSAADQLIACKLLPAWLRKHFGLASSGGF